MHPRTTLYTMISGNFSNKPSPENIKPTMTLQYSKECRIKSVMLQNFSTDAGLFRQFSTNSDAVVQSVFAPRTISTSNCYDYPDPIYFSGCASL